MAQSDGDLNSEPSPPRKPSGRGAERSEWSPFDPPSFGQSDSSVTRSSKDQSIDAEPWLKQVFFQPDPSDKPRFSDHRRPIDLEDLAENSVWDEPATNHSLTGPPDPYSVTWFGYYLTQVAKTPISMTWLVTLLILIAAGPLAIVGTLITGSGRNAWLMFVVMGPTIEEILKIALPLWVVEKKPWLFSNSLQILLCGVVAGLMFAVIENLIYLYVYVPDPSDLLVIWRWTVCVVLHTGCSMIAALGVIAIRRGMLERESRPQLSDGSKWIVAAIVIHGSYNFIAILIDHLF